MITAQAGGSPRRFLWGPALGSLLSNVICNFNDNIAGTLVRFAGDAKAE